MITLGIETSCDETSVAIVRNGRHILSNVISSSLKEHKPYGGVVPEIASRAHLEVLPACLDQALKLAKTPLKRVDLIAVTQGPGLMGSLLVGISSAKALALALNRPLIGVDHIIAHVYSVFLGKTRVKFPILGLVVSGGHTFILRMDGPKLIKILGKTLDDAAGEAFDKVAKMLGLGYPGGPEVDRLSRGQDPTEILFTRPYLSPESLDFSFSGIKTAVYYAVDKFKAANRLTPKTKKAVCAGFQEAVCDVLVRKTLRAASQEGIATVVVCGGVSANSRLRDKFAQHATKERIRVFFPDMALCQDNAAMIAALGTALHEAGQKSSLDLAGYSDFFSKK